jgi:hypothetical protein
MDLNKSMGPAGPGFREAVPDYKFYNKLFHARWMWNGVCPRISARICMDRETRNEKKPGVATCMSSEPTVADEKALDPCSPAGT